MADADEVVAAGAVVWRPRREVLLVHRPRYDDWSFPKGKLDPGEDAAVAAVREVEEETGLTVRLTRPLPMTRYPNGSRMKQVHYWVGRVEGSDDVSGYLVNDEIDEVVWLPFDEALDTLSYEHDRETLHRAGEVHAPTTALVVLRHAHAKARSGWTADDRLRPLAEDGQRQAARLAATLAAFGIRRIVTSTSVRCVQTVQPYAEAAGLKVREDEGLSEEGATRKSLTLAAEKALVSTKNTVICSHRPVLPDLFEVLGLEPVALAPGEMAVLHHRRGDVCAFEVRSAP
jgi:8-oxo-dGTP pyrophosphatase MutT (NUDIX family)/phosphohistidine phosphatase SixA